VHLPSAEPALSGPTGVVLMRGGLGRRITAASAMLAGVIGGVFAALAFAVAEERETTRLALHSQQALATANQLERLLIDIETGERGYLLTGQDKYLEPWHAARAEVPVVVRQLERSSITPEQRRRADGIARSVESYIADHSVPVVAQARAGDHTARSPATFDNGKRRIDGARAQFTAFATAERQLSAERATASARTFRWLVGGGIAGATGSVLLIGLFAGYLMRFIVTPVRQAAAMSGRLAAGDLGVRMPAHGIGEIGVLSRSFNAMGRSLQQHRAELVASRARVVAATDRARYRIERDLHDGVQQRLVALTLDVRVIEADLPPGAEPVRRDLRAVAAGLNEALDELREVSRGIHPAILTEAGLPAALRALARRSGLAVEVDTRVPGRLPDPVEVAVYYLVAEALTNVAKHAEATAVRVEVEAGAHEVRLVVRDDGVGGATPARGSGLIGLTDRVEALGGTLRLTSPPGDGTELAVTLPLAADPPASR
jgi:signal transduction histidine kinase